MCQRELGNAADMAGDPKRSRDLHREALSLFHAHGAERDVAVTAANLAETEFQEGNVEEALTANSEAILIERSLKAFARLIVSLSNRAAYLLSLDRLDESRDLARESLVLARELQAELFLANALQILAAISAARGELRRAAELAGYCDARFIEFRMMREYTEQYVYDNLIARIRANLPDSELTPLLQEGSRWTEDQAVSEALNV
jgi:tetratricopeptide (TPR) repeat protein